MGGVVTVVIRPAVRRDSSGRERLCRSLGVAYVTGVMDSALVVTEASCPYRDASKDFSRGARDAKDN